MKDEAKLAMLTREYIAVDNLQFKLWEKSWILDWKREIVH